MPIAGLLLNLSESVHAFYIYQYDVMIPANRAN